MLTQSLVKGYGQKGISPRCLIKVDIKKAFDSLQWEFIDKMFQYYNFPPQFKIWILGCITSTWFSLKINGDRVGFFQGAGGLRQGDPLSPFLFVMSMEILSRILRQIHKQPQVSYHPKCGPVRLNHLIFADDLMLFVRGDIPSVAAVTHALDMFASMSGLYANPEKTNIYMGGVQDVIKQGILQATGFKEGDFPFRYLGVPLNDGKLNKSMFADLLNRVQKALQHWSTHKLSYAGKISLLNSVILGMEQYWCSTLLIPKGVIKLITKFCRNFLWNSEEGSRKLIMKSWVSCCVPHKEGGFNIKEVLAWNKCILGKWIWELEQGSDSIWFDWHSKYNIKSGSIWTAVLKPTHSESWRSILKVRDELLLHTGTIQNAKQFMASCVHQGRFQLNMLYDKFRHCLNTVSWAKVIWQRAVIPKHSVFLTLAMQKKLATIDQLNCRGIQLVNRCVLCKQDNENHKHLFFKCSFSKEVWHGILSWMKISGRTTSLNKELHWGANRGTCKHWKTKWFLGCLGAVVYSIWEERNARIFQGVEHNVDGIIKRVQFLEIVEAGVELPAFPETLEYTDSTGMTVISEIRDFSEAVTDAGLDKWQHVVRRREHGLERELAQSQEETTHLLRELEARDAQIAALEATLTELRGRQE
ncbi:uncharacterized protein LOC141602180 [Silene latifolia]|uniref:uncharacterized protein LOC141602180 n=1 Tax=Silene latifolia TaxID=37657 RepID=UPI003D784E0F